LSAGPTRSLARRLSPFVTALGIVLTLVGVIGALTNGGANGGGAAAEPTTTTRASSSTAPPSTTRTTTPGTTTTRATTGTTAPPDVSPQTFFAAFGRALAGGDSAFLIAHLHPLVVARYGADQCRAYLTGLSVPKYSVQVLSVGAPEAWDWTLDGKTDRVENAVPVKIRSTEDGVTFRDVDSHVVVAGGTVRWFTDCGTPV
jgi:hypothetical protein